MITAYFLFKKFLELHKSFSNINKVNSFSLVNSSEFEITYFRTMATFAHVSCEWNKPKYKHIGLFNADIFLKKLPYENAPNLRKEYSSISEYKMIQCNYQR